jgi:hypothetical protein
MVFRGERGGFHVCLDSIKGGAKAALNQSKASSLRAKRGDPESRAESNNWIASLCSQ